MANSTGHNDKSLGDYPRLLRPPLRWDRLNVRDQAVDSIGTSDIQCNPQLFRRVIPRSGSRAVGYIKKQFRPDPVNSGLLSTLVSRGGFARYGVGHKQLMETKPAVQNCRWGLSQYQEVEGC